MRNYIGIILSLLLFGLVPAEDLIAQEIVDSLKILHLTDIHLCDYNNYHPSLRKKRRAQYQDNYDAFRKFLQTIPAYVHADQIITTGDNVDFYMAETPDGDIKGGLIDYFLSLSATSPVPVYLTLGNHETSMFYTKDSKLNRNKKGGHYAAMQARTEWTRKAECFRNGTYYSGKYQIGGTSYLLLFLDVTYQVPNDPTVGYWNPEMLEWIEYQLEENADSNCLMFFHIPIPVADNNGDGEVILEPKAGWPDSTTYRSGIMKILNEHDRVKALVVGHIHQNVIEKIQMPRGHGIYEIAAGGFGENENNWRLLTLKPEVIEISKPGTTGIEIRIENIK